MNKAGLKKMSAEMLKMENKLSEEETTAYMKQNFQRIWKQKMEDNDGDFQFEENTARDFIQALLWYDKFFTEVYLGRSWNI